MLSTSRTCQVFGDEGSLYWDFESGRVTRYGHEAVEETIEQPGDWTVNRMYVDEVRHFLACVEQGIAAPNGVAEATESLRIALAARRAGARGEAARTMEVSA